MAHVKRMDNLDIDGDRQCSDAGVDWGDRWPDGSLGAAGDSGYGTSVLRTIFDGLCRGSITSTVGDGFLAMVAPKSPLFGVVHGSFPWDSRGDDRRTSCRYPRSASPDYSPGSFGLCVFGGDGNHVFSDNRKGDRAAGLAGAAYGGNALFLVSVHDGICVSGAVELDLFWADNFGGIGYGHSVMAPIEELNRCRNLVINPIHLESWSYSAG
jgi:hypothetical protein